MLWLQNPRCFCISWSPTGYSFCMLCTVAHECDLDLWLMSLRKRGYISFDNSCYLLTSINISWICCLRLLRRAKHQVTRSSRLKERWQKRQSKWWQRGEGGNNYIKREKNRSNGWSLSGMHYPLHNYTLIRCLAPAVPSIASAATREYLCKPRLLIFRNKTGHIILFTIFSIDYL